MRRNEQTAGFARLATCGSVWACPRCSAVIAVERSAEIGRAVEACHKAGGATYMVTFTMRHHAGHTLGELWSGLSEGWSKTFRDHEWTGVRGRWRKGKDGTDRWVAETVGDRDRFDVGGTVRCVEATFSRPKDGGNGWHLHAHVLLMAMEPSGNKLDPDRVAEVLDVDTEYVTEEVREAVAMLGLGSRLFRRWIAGVTKAGLPAPSGAGLDIRRVTDQGADFIGNYLSKATLDVARKIGAEVGGGVNTKTVDESVEKVSVTPFELLNSLTERHSDESVCIRVPNNQWTWEAMPEGGSQIVDHGTGEIMEVAAFSEFPRWHEWEQGSRGRRQLLWSQRVKEPLTDRETFWNELLDARGREAKDEDIAAREIRGETVAQIHRAEWFDRMVRKPEWFTDLLETVEDADDDESAALAAQEWGVRHGVVVNGRSG